MTNMKYIYNMIKTHNNSIPVITTSLIINFGLGYYTDVIIGQVDSDGYGYTKSNFLFPSTMCTLWFTTIFGGITVPINAYFTYDNYKLKQKYNAYNKIVITE